MNAHLESKTFGFASGVVSPDEIIFSADNAANQPRLFRNHTGSFRLRHNRKANLVFLDGHVSHYGAQDIFNRREWMNYDYPNVGYAGWGNWNLSNFIIQE